MYPEIAAITAWLDEKSGLRDNPVADDMSRVMKVGEEYGEAVQALIGVTGQNPRKGVTHTREELLAELADIVVTALCAIQHFTQSATMTEQTISAKIASIMARSPEIGQPVNSIALWPAEELAVLRSMHDPSEGL